MKVARWLSCATVVGVSWIIGWEAALHTECVWGESEGRPNILIITTDQQRIDAVSALGNKWVKTPNLDRLAAEGI